MDDNLIYCFLCFYFHGQNLLQEQQNEYLSHVHIV